MEFCKGTDSDNDSICDELDVCPLDSENDADNDGLCADVDICPYDSDNDIDNDGICNDDEIPGCTDPNACNYDPDLGCTDDDGSCFYSEITANVVIIDASCEAACDGEIQLTIDNGQPPYLVEYNSGEFSYSTGGNLVNACVGTCLLYTSPSPRDS